MQEANVQKLIHYERSIILILIENNLFLFYFVKEKFIRKPKSQPKGSRNARVILGAPNIIVGALSILSEWTKIPFTQADLYELYGSTIDHVDPCGLYGRT